MSETSSTIEEAIDGIRERNSQIVRLINRKMEFSKKLMIFISTLFTVALGICLYAWAAGLDIPWQFVEIAGWLLGASCVSYCGKSAYENGCKIKEGDWHG